MKPGYVEFLEVLRLAELQLALAVFEREKSAPARLLEIGSGSGWQAKHFSEAGFDVSGIDIAQSAFAELRVWDVTDYDGHHIPFPDNEFDIIFSSNVLEHIAHVEEFQNEIKRVLKDDGIALHLLPTGTWRIWTNISHYHFAASYAIQRLRLKFVSRFGTTETPVVGTGRDVTAEGWSTRAISPIEMIKSLIPPRHGEVGNAITEMYHFSKSKWQRLFRRTGWKIEKYSTNQLFYTGYMMFGDSWRLSFREKLSRILGSSCHIFLLRKS